MRRHGLFAAVLVAVVALSVLAPVGTVAADEHELSVVVSDDGFVTVTANETGVDNATVTVALDDPENESYAGADENHTTDADGEVALPEPNESVTVDVTAASGNETASVTATLEPAVDLALDVSQNESEDVTVTVTDGEEAVANASVDGVADDENVSYAASGVTD